MKNLENLRVVEMTTYEKAQTEGGLFGLDDAYVAAVVAVGAGVAWCFEKGESLGKALAHKH